MTYRSATGFYLEYNDRCH